LKPVDTVVHTRPVVGVTHSKLISADLCRAIASFDQKKLKDVETRVTLAPCVGVTKALPKTICTAIKSFDQSKLKDVKPRVSRKPVVGIFSNQLISTELFHAIATFDQRKLKDVDTRITNKPVVVVARPPAPSAAIPPPPPPPAPVAPAVPGAALLTSNLAKLEELGFNDRKTNIAALVESRNCLENAIVALLERKY